MSLITFDIKYKNKLDNESIRLIPDSELQQLKLMICGKYKIYDLNNLYIYYKNNLISENDTIKIKEIFKMKKVLIEISETPKISKKDSFKYFCKNCKSGATYICDKCDELLCEICISKKQHINHTNKLVKIKEYYPYIKSTLKELASELDKQILNDEAYQFFQYWSYDVDTEINNINNAYEFIKNQLEDIKQMEIDYIIALGQANKYEILKQKIEEVINQYGNVNTEAEIDKIFEEKKIILKNSKDILIWYNELKNQCLNYTKTIKDMQTFNQILLKEIKDKFNITKKRYSQIPFINNNLMNGSAILSPNNLFNNTTDKINININNNDISDENNFIDTNILKENNNINNNNRLNTPKNTHSKLNSSSVNNNYNNTGSNEKKSPNVINSINANESLNTSHISSGNKKEKVIFKLKDEHKMIIFFIAKQSFREKNFYDRGNFRKDFTTEADVIQLNLLGKLFMLSGKNFNKFFYYDLSSNSIYNINNTLYSHYYGSMSYCPKNNCIYLLGGNNQTKCEIYNMSLINKKTSWKQIPSLNEERQEFATLYFNDFIYVFFGFSSKKGINLSSIERINVNDNAQFEVVYINEQITLSSLGCAYYTDENENDKDKKNGILLLGGFDGENYVDTSLVFNPAEMKIRDCDIVIPNMNKHSQFLFHKESAFIGFDSGAQYIFDMQNNVHLLTSDSYELFSEAV